ncbi:two-component system sensor histidine kinase DesK [Streptomyces phaeochromogenes]|jgi:two-component system, NarL family, sensor histidine kinase DesK|uniref:sensor histidine kinase n=1 Tax=Streptomyces phaeochromogenes TaxID=1923 RepID=UPI00278DDA01|nr:two-component system sensor histidine kinase DesK [Streptomyces phaeochromogenes]
MSWLRRVSCQMSAWQESRTEWKADRDAFVVDQKAVRKTGKLPEHLGPPPSGFALLPWLLMGMGAFSNLFQGKTPNPWIGGIGLLVFNSLYIHVVFRAFTKEAREARSTRGALIALGIVTCLLGGLYGGSWLLFFPLLGLAAGAIVRGRWLGRTGIGLSALAGVVAGLRDGWGAVNVAYGTFLSTMVTAAILSLSDAVRELRAAREELARQAVEKERLRFSRDLHDLLGHTLSVIVVKSEAARRLAPRDMDAALVQVSDIESVGRQALTEIREAVTGYREGSLAADLERAGSALRAAGIEPVVRQSGPPLAAQTEVLLGWVVREAVTNAVRHSGAGRCEITVDGSAEHVRLRVTDDGRGVAPPAAPESPVPGIGGTGIGGTGLKGLTERLAAAGGSLEAGPGARNGFTVAAELPVDPGERMSVPELSTGRVPSR